MSEQAHPIPAGWLVMYHDGELDAARREQFEAHVATCDACQRELAALKSLSGMLAAVVRVIIRRIAGCQIVIIQ